MSFAAIIGAVIANMIIGWLWYSKPLFGEHWLRHSGRTDKKSRQAIKAGAKNALFGMLAIALLMAFVFEIIFNNFGVTGASAGMIVAFWIWLGFIVTTQAYAVFYEKQKWQVFWIHASCQFLSLLAMGAILGRW